MASGNTLLIFLPSHNEPPATVYATPDTRNPQPCLDFDGATDEEAIFSGVMPSHYAAGGIAVILHVGFTTATTGTANIECSVERGTTDKDADSFDTMTDGSAVPNGTSGIETVVTIALVNNDGIVAGNRRRVEIRRGAGGTN